MNDTKSQSGELVASGTGREHRGMAMSHGLSIIYPAPNLAQLSEPG